MTRTLPTYSIEIAWSTALSGVFALDHSTLDGPDVLPGTFGNNIFDDVTNVCQTFTITRGRTSDLSAIAQGVCTMQLYDPDGTYNPENPSSPLNGLITDMRPIRIRATHLSVTYGLFYGYLSRLVEDPTLGNQFVTIEAVDLFEWLATTKPVIASMGATTTGAAIGAILSSVGWNDASMRVLNSGSNIPDFFMDGTKFALQAITDLLTVDLGLFFIDGSGRARYIDRQHIYTGIAPVSTFTGSMVMGLQPGFDTRTVVNRQDVTRTGGVLQEATNEASRKLRNYRDGNAITSDYLVDDAHAFNLASWIVMARGTPQSASRSLLIPDTDDTLIPQQFGREIGDLVAIDSIVGGSDTLGTIQGLQHTFVAGPDAYYDASLTVIKRTQTMFALDVSTLDGPDILGY